MKFEKGQVWIAVPDHSDVPIYDYLIITSVDYAEGTHTWLGVSARLGNMDGWSFNDKRVNGESYKLVNNLTDLEKIIYNIMEGH